MSTYNRYNDEQTANNNAVLAVFAIVLAALIVIGFMMASAPTIDPAPGGLNQETRASRDSGDRIQR